MRRLPEEAGEGTRSDLKGAQLELIMTSRRSDCSLAPPALDSLLLVAYTSSSRFGGNDALAGPNQILDRSDNLLPEPLAR